MKDVAHAVDALPPPGEAVRAHRVPIVERDAPVLAPLLRELVLLEVRLRRCAARPVELKLVRPGKDIRAVVADAKRNVAHQAPRRAPRRRPSPPPTACRRSIARSEKNVPAPQNVTALHSTAPPTRPAPPPPCAAPPAIDPTLRSRRFPPSTRGRKRNRPATPALARKNPQTLSAVRCGPGNPRERLLQERALQRPHLSDISPRHVAAWRRGTGPSLRENPLASDPPASPARGAASSAPAPSR